MFKKLIALMMVLSIFTVQAQASTHDGLKAAFDELNYALTVEWDQKDKDFHADQMKKFTASLRDLQSKGLTNAQLVDFAKSQVKNAQVAKDLETALNMIQINKMAPAEANKYILDTMKKSYSAGASWNGEVFIYLAVGVLIVALAVAIASGGTSTGGGYNNGNNCYYDDVYVCDTYCYDDYPFGYTCYDDCYWTSQYTCY
jgi:hypothetical protein